MLWFDGPIRNAVDKVKSSGVLFVVFVKGTDELSKKYEICMNKTLQLESQECVALKIVETSTAFQQFKEIYVTVPVPSVFLINNNGIPLKVVSSQKVSDIPAAINDALKIQNVNSLKLEKLTKKEKQPNNDSSNCKRSTLRDDIPKSFLNKNIGYKLFDVSEEELKKRLNEIRAFPRFLPLNNPMLKENFVTPPISKIHSARIQFRLPNNDVASWEFPDLSTLHDVKAYLMEKIDLSPNFKLLRAYPRTGFSPQDEQKTLVDLSLTPNATLIVIPVQDKTVQAKVKGVIAHQNITAVVMKTFMQPFVIFIDFLKKYILKIENNNGNIRPQRLPSNTSVGKILNKKTSTSNFHGFNFDENSDNENDHPDNGNSTQQRYEK